jgi:hypothetical protein
MALRAFSLTFSPFPLNASICHYWDLIDWHGYPIPPDSVRY